MNLVFKREDLLEVCHWVLLTKVLYLSQEAG